MTARIDAAALQPIADALEACLAAADAHVGAMPDVIDAGVGCTEWFARRRVAMDALADQLRAKGWAIHYDWSGARVRFGRVAASSTSGLHGALYNWIAAVRRRQQRADLTGDRGQ